MMSARRHLTRHVVVAVAVGTTMGCSLLFDMGRYDEGPAGNASGSSASSGSSSSGRVREDGATVGDDANASSSGSTSSDDAQAVVDSGFDATVDCVFEIEPNEDETEATPMPVGSICGQLATVDDLDYFVFSATKSETLKILTTQSITVDIWRDGSNIATLSGNGTNTVPSGTGQIVIGIRYNSGASVRAYKLTRSG